MDHLVRPSVFRGPEKHRDLPNVTQLFNFWPEPGTQAPDPRGAISALPGSVCQPGGKLWQWHNRWMAGLCACN